MVRATPFAVCEAIRRLGMALEAGLTLPVDAASEDTSTNEHKPPCASPCSGGLVAIRQGGDDQERHGPSFCVPVHVYLSLSRPNERNAIHANHRSARGAARATVGSAAAQ